MGIFNPFKKKQQKNDLEIREIALINAQYICKTTENIADYAQLIIDYHEMGKCDVSCCERAVNIATEAAEIGKKSALVVRDPDIDKVEPTISACKQRIDELNNEITSLVKKVQS